MQVICVKQNVRRGQSSVEYLLTYGWAIVAVIVTVGAFASFGVLTPSKYLPARCDFGAQMVCLDYVLYAGTTDHVFFRLQNNYGEDIKIHSISLMRDQGSGKVVSLPLLSGGMLQTSDIDPFPASGVIIANGESNGTYAVGVELAGGATDLVTGQKSLVIVAVNFSRTALNAPTHLVYGEIFAAPTKFPS